MDNRKLLTLSGKNKMSSSFIVEPKDKSKKDDTLIIVVNDDGTISVDHETLQNIISK